jgi:hypothetical protein
MLQDLLPLTIWALEFAWLAAFLVGVWKTFVKAGASGWRAFVPVYNAVVLTRLSGRRAWPFALLLLIPGINLFAIVPVSVGLAARFGKGMAFGVGLAYLPIVFYPLLGLGKSQCLGWSPR